MVNNTARKREKEKDSGLKFKFTKALLKHKFTKKKLDLKTLFFMKFYVKNH